MSYNCNICNNSYKSRQSLWNHNNKFHKKNDNKNKHIKQYECEYCKKI